MTTDYKKQATDFLEQAETELKAEFKSFSKHFEEDKHKRLIFKITLKRGQRLYTFDFGASFKDAEEFFRGLMLKNKYSFLPDWAEHFKYPARVIADEDALKTLEPMIMKNKELLALPTAYDVLTCLTKIDPGTLEDFCSEFGYDTDSKKAERTYNAVCKEWQNIRALWTDAEIAKLQEIQ